MASKPPAKKPGPEAVASTKNHAKHWYVSKDCSIWGEVNVVGNVERAGPHEQSMPGGVGMEAVCPSRWPAELTHLQDQARSMSLRDLITNTERRVMYQVHEPEMLGDCDVFLGLT